MSCTQKTRRYIKNPWNEKYVASQDFKVDQARKYAALHSRAPWGWGLDAVAQSLTTHPTGVGEIYRNNERSLPSTGLEVYYRIGADRPWIQEGESWTIQDWLLRDVTSERQSYVELFGVTFCFHPSIQYISKKLKLAKRKCSHPPHFLQNHNKIEGGELCASPISIFIMVLCAYLHCNALYICLSTQESVHSHSAPDP